MTSGVRYLVGGRNFSLLIGKLNLKKIPFYDLEQRNNEIFITIKQKDCKKFIDLVGENWYYKYIGKTGKAKFAEKLIKNIGIILGAIIFMVGTFVFDNMLLSIKVESDSAFYNDINVVLTNNGVKKYAWFKDINLSTLQDEIYAQNPLISYSSVYKSGNTLVVKCERANSFTHRVDTSKTALISPCKGQILSLVTLRGYPLKAEGDFVSEGEVLVSGEKVEEDKWYSTFVIASAKILCEFVYEGTESESVAILKAQLLCGKEEYFSQEAKIVGDKIKVTLKYIVEI